ncbi:unnamed protein product [Ranitomeya imitator]|uniref:Uncharacterized protein n=1 Tax=Ranitomeya imitator TaxID=111125 RepID=A0ABN9KUL6_9NEOB|nr:unnamed protein product [Ranitomeya imitator]
MPAEEVGGAVVEETFSGTMVPGHKIQILKSEKIKGSRGSTDSCLISNPKSSCSGLLRQCDGSLPSTSRGHEVCQLETNRGKDILLGREAPVVYLGCASQRFRQYPGGLPEQEGCPSGRMVLEPSSLPIPDHEMGEPRGRGDILQGDCRGRFLETELPLQSSFGPEERLTNVRELTILPKEDSCIQLMFSPTRVGCMLAKLEIKQSGIKPSQPGIKFTIPLSGYGGTSNVILEGVKKLSDSYMITLSGLMADRVSKGNVSVRNTGSRAAYVKAVCFVNVQKGLLMDSGSCSVTPEKFILKEGTQEIVTISFNGTALEECLQSSTSLLFTVCFFCGDEVSRQQFRRALQYKPESAQKTIAENARLKNIRFDEEFRSEHLVSEVCDLPQRPNDVQLFYGNMHKVALSVFGSASEVNNGETLLPCRNINLASPLRNTERNFSNASLDVLPVRGPQGPFLTNSNVSFQKNVLEQHPWSVLPEALMLKAPAAGGLATTGHIQIVNNAPKSLQFDLSWPAHYLTIKPQHGNVQPQSHAIIQVIPNPLMSTKQSMLPWSGQIYIHCDFGQKIVKVQIISEVIPVMSANGVPKSLSVFSTHMESPSHVAKPVSKSTSSKVEIKNRTVVFPRTVAGFLVVCEHDPTDLFTVQVAHISFMVDIRSMIREQVQNTAFSLIPL